jgi:hypothetical protein
MRRLGALLALALIALTRLQGVGCGSGAGSMTHTPPPVQFVQTTGSTVSPWGSGESFTTTFSSPVAAGSTIVMVFWWMHDPNVDSGIPGVSDSEGNDYQEALVTKALINSSTQADIVYYYAPNVKGDTPAAVTITTNAQAHTTQVSTVVLEYSGVSSVDATDTASVLNGSTESTDMATTHAAPEVVLGSLLTTYITPMGAGTGFSSRFQSSYFVVEDKVVNSAGSYDAEFSMPPYPQYLIAVPSMVTLR